MITFPVDDEVPERVLDESRPLGERHRGTLAYVGNAGAPDVAFDRGDDALWTAVYLAHGFGQPLLVTPDAVWLAILRGATYDARFALGSWRAALAQWERMPVPELPSLVDTRAFDPLCDPDRVCDFSTTTPADRLASQVILTEQPTPLRSFAANGSFVPTGGIPSVTLAGTPDDWRRIRARVERLQGPAGWIPSLRFILDELVATAEGAPRRAFWQEILLPSPSGRWGTWHGWVGRLYPWVEGRSAWIPNPILAIDHPTVVAALATEDTSTLPSTVVPPWHRARAAATLRTTEGTREVRFITDLYGVVRDSEGRLCPCAGVYVVPVEDTDEEVRIWARLMREQDVVETDDTLDVTVRVGGACFRSPPAQGRLRVELPNVRDWAAVGLWIELPDGDLAGNLFGRAITLPPGSWRIRDDDTYRRYRMGLDYHVATPSELEEMRQHLVTECLLPRSEIRAFRVSALALLEYAMDHDGALPPSVPLDVLLAELGV